MIDAIIGRKGAGKTAALVEEINALAADDKNNVVLLQVDHRLDRQIPYTVRAVDVNEYPVNGYSELLAFVAGICAKDYDISHLYIDSIFKVAKDTDLLNLEHFMKKLADFSTRSNLDVTLTISAEENELSSTIQTFVRKN